MTITLLTLPHPPFPHYYLGVLVIGMSFPVLGRLGHKTIGLLRLRKEGCTLPVGPLRICVHDLQKDDS